MTTIIPTEKPARWIIPSQEIDGQTLIGELTVVSLSVLDLIWSEGDNEFLQAIDASAYVPPDLPSSGFLEYGDVYTWSSQVVMVRQSHNRTLFPPDETPALFIFAQVGEGILEWIVGEQVNVGTIRSYLAINYRCIQAHVTQIDWIPPSVSSLWAVFVEPTAEWQVGVAYSVNDEVTYQGSTYRCLQAHTSIASWNPPAVPALWQLI